MLYIFWPQVLYQINNLQMFLLIWGSRIISVILWIMLVVPHLRNHCLFWDNISSLLFSSEKVFISYARVAIFICVFTHLPLFFLHNFSSDFCNPGAQGIPTPILYGGHNYLSSVFVCFLCYSDKFPPCNDGLHMWQPGSPGPWTTKGTDHLSCMNTHGHSYIFPALLRYT